MGPRWCSKNEGVRGAPALPWWRREVARGLYVHFKNTESTHLGPDLQTLVRQLRPQTLVCAACLRHLPLHAHAQRHLQRAV